MIALFRHKTLQRGITALLLVVAVFLPLQISYACELMHGQQSTHCCCTDAKSGCEHGGGCSDHVTDTDRPAGTDQTSCCTLSLDSPAQSIVSTTSLSTHWLLDSTAPDHLVDTQDYRLTGPVPAESPLVIDAFAASTFTDNHLTYLYTRRLRV